MKRLTELMFVLSVIAVVVHFQLKKERATAPPSQPTPALAVATPAPDSPPPAYQTVSMGQLVPDFTLTNADGGQTTHRAGEGPLLIVLTATGCGECLQRIDAADQEGYEMAQQANVPVWNLLVFHPNDRAAEFKDQHKPHADQVLADPTSDISVRMLGGSDATCWIMLDKEGKLAYRAGAQPAALEQALQKLRSR